MCATMGFRPFWATTKYIFLKEREIYVCNNKHRFQVGSRLYIIKKMKKKTYQRPEITFYEMITVRGSVSRMPKVEKINKIFPRKKWKIRRRRGRNATAAFYCHFNDGNYFCRDSTNATCFERIRVVSFLWLSRENATCTKRAPNNNTTDEIADDLQ